MRIRAVPGPAVVAALAPAALVLTHDLLFLLTYGPSYGRALTATGHDPRWEGAVGTVLAVTGLAAVVAVVRLARLWAEVGSTPHPAAGGLHDGQRASMRWPPVSLWTSMARMWAALLPLVAGLLVAQESLERWAAGEPLPGLAPLLADHGLGLVLVTAVTFALSLVGGLLRWSHARVIGLLTAVRRRPRRRAPAAGRPVIHESASPASLLGRSLAGRAPPFPAA